MRVELRALVFLLRYSDLRIGDVVSLSRERIADGKVFRYTAKTGTPVWCPLHDAVIQALATQFGIRHSGCLRTWFCRVGYQSL
jgi:hypothetical protein